ncbi:MAG: glycosyltransferase [Chitinophagales bacterium]|nr:glycosyltransferase [Chitinophagales bacterium]
MSLYVKGWKQTKTFSVMGEGVSKTVSVIIPVRNEEKSIGLLIEDLLHQDYPKHLTEIVIVDDFSDDNTVNIVLGFHDKRVKLIRMSDIENLLTNEKAYKKRAIELGIRQATGEIILTTDGDCRVKEQWIRTMLQIQKETQAKLLTGAVVMTNTHHRFQKFQALDFLGMMGITAAMLQLKIYNMANGANLLFEKKAFEEIDGYRGVNHLASGDDMLLMYKIAQQYQNQVAFAKHPQAVVYTETMPTLGGFLQQRFRWTAKSKDYQDKRMTWMLGLVFLFVLTLFVNFFLLFFYTSILVLTALQLVVKSIVDYRLLNSTSTYYGRKGLMKSFVSSQIFHILYIVFVGSLGNILKFEWKGRKLDK